jgi:hypothetical protein
VYRQLFSLLIALGLIASSAWAQDDTDSDSAGIYAQIGSVGSVGILGRYISLESAAGVRSGPFTLALVPRLLWGTTQFDVHIAPQLLLQAGPVYLQPGWVFELIDKTDAYQIVDSGPAGAIGVRTELVQVSGGSLVLDLGYELFFPLQPDTAVPDASNLAPNSYLDDLLSLATAISVPYTMLRLGLLYTFGD